MSRIPQRLGVHAAEYGGLREWSGVKREVNWSTRRYMPLNTAV
jgi:hypothetical protein